MSLHLTPAMLELCYELLRATPPFKRWKLPHADEVEFHVTRDTQIVGDCVDAGHAHIIRLSGAKHGSVHAVVVTMAHEMCHLKQSVIAPREGAHGRYFKRLAKQVCKAHGFDEKTF